GPPPPAPPHQADPRHLASAPSSPLPPLTRSRPRPANLVGAMPHFKTCTARSTRLVAVDGRSRYPRGSTGSRLTWSFTVELVPLPLAPTGRRHDRYLRGNGGRDNQHDCWNREV